MGLIGEGLKMMVVGMGMVYVFLVVMICLMKLMSKLLAPYSHLLAPAPSAAKKSAEQGVDPALVAAAVAAYSAAKK